MAANPVIRFCGAGLACLAVVIVATGWRSPLAAIAGLAGPLVAAAVSWLLLERAHARRPEQVSALMIKLFGAKLVLFGAYAASMMSLLSTGRIVFVVSFVSHYILLHLMEALYLRRLFADGPIDGRRLGIS